MIDVLPLNRLNLIDDLPRHRDQESWVRCAVSNDNGVAAAVVNAVWEIVANDRAR